MDWIMDKNKAICPQIEEQLAVRISTGLYQPGEKIPSVREVSTMAGVNPNTVQKAYSNLERRNVIFSKAGSGWYVCEEPEKASDLVQEMIREKTEAFLEDMKALGFSVERVLEAIKEVSHE